MQQGMRKKGSLFSRVLSFGGNLLVAEKQIIGGRYRKEFKDLT